MWICERSPDNYPVLERLSAVENVWTNSDQPVNFRRPYKPFWIQAIYDTYRNVNGDGQTNKEEEQNSDQTDGQMEVTDESSENVGDGGANDGTDAENTTTGEVNTTGNDGDPDITTQSFMVTMED